MTLTPEDQIIAFIGVHIQQHGYGPTYREIADALGYRSVSAVSYHINNAIVAGRLHRLPTLARTVRPTNLPLPPMHGYKKQEA
jgi:SOS-response transcriptional repressor LexA